MIDLVASNVSTVGYPISQSAMLAVRIDRGKRDFGKSEPSDQSFGHCAFPDTARALRAGYESPGDRMFFGLLSLLIGIFLLVFPSGFCEGVDRI